MISLSNSLFEYLNYFASDVFGFIDPVLKPKIILIGIDNSVRCDFSSLYYHYPTRKPDPLADKPLFKIAQRRPEVGPQLLDQIFEIQKTWKQTQTRPTLLLSIDKGEGYFAKIRSVANSVCRGQLRGKNDLYFWGKTGKYIG